MKIKRLIFFAALLLTFASGAWADPVPQAIWCSGNTTLYFTYAEPVTQDSSYGGQTVTYVFSGSDFNYGVWANLSDITGYCTTVVFESSFASARPTKCTNWFVGFGVLTNIQGIENLNTSEVTNMGSMFANCVALSSIDLSHFNTAKVTDMESMFQNCTGLTTLDLSNFDTSNVTNMIKMFYGCTALNTLTVATGWTKITSYSDRFKNCTPSTIHLVMDDDKDSHCLLEEFSELISGKAVNVTLRGRKLYKNNDWNTLCLPFSFSATQIADSEQLAGATLKELDASASKFESNGTLTLTFVPATNIEAGKPYLIKWEGASGDFILGPVFNDVTITSNAPTPVEFNNAVGNNCQFVGQYAPFSITEGNRYEILMLGSGSKLGYSTPRTLRCFRAHFVVPTTTDAPAMTSYAIDFDGEPTGVISTTDLTDFTNSDNRWYTLDGRCISVSSDASVLPKGIYIINGKKVLVP